MRILTVATAICCAVVSLSVAGEAAAAIKPATSIPAQGLEPALQVFAADRNLQIVYRSEVVGDLRTPGAAGELSVDEALTQLLSGTGLTFHYIDRQTVTIVRANSAESAGQRRASGTIAEGDSSVQLEEVIVTATKRAQSVQDIPLSIAVIGNHEIERRGLIGMEDYLRSIPGVSQIDNGAVSNAIVIRGISTSPQFENSALGSGPTVATYFDETPITGAAGLGAGGIDVRPVDMERIEVLRGPQGTTFGSSSLGGALRMLPAKPQLHDFSARLAASYSGTSGEGSDNSMMQGVVNVPIVIDQLALRAVGYRYEESGFYRNVAGSDPATLTRAASAGLTDFVSGYVRDDVGRMTSTGGRFAALWKPVDELNVSLSYLTQTIEQDGAPEATLGNYEQAYAPIAPQARVDGERGDFAETEMELASLVVGYELPWAAITAVTSRIESGSRYARDLGVQLPFTASTALPSDFDSFSSEVRLASRLDGRLQFLGGVFYEDVDERMVQTYHWPGAPAPSPVFVSNPMALIDRTRQFDQRALFGEVSYEVTERLTATLGARYFEYDKDESVLQEGGLVGVPLGSGTVQTLRSAEDGSTFKANLTYEPADDALIYLAWSEGFRLGRPSSGLSAFGSICDQNSDGVIDGSSVTIESTKTIASDFLENYELGGKFELLDGRMLVDAAIYHIEWDGLPVRTVAPSCNRGYVANVGAATSQGAELHGTWSVMSGLKIDFGGGYTNAELSEDAPGLPAFAGDRLPGSPRVSANLAAQYEFDAGPYRAFVRADSFYVGSFFGDVQGTPLTRAGDYVKVDARAGIGIRNASIELFVRNLTNEDAFTWRGLSNGSSFFGYRLRPRTAGIQVSYSFE
jgi:iron complex outermembrane recepter protein